MSKGVESIFVTRQKIVVLPKAESIVAKCVCVDVGVKYSEPKFNQLNGRIIKRVPRGWSRGIHSVNRVPRPNSPHSTYSH
jgi:hypothetical protein